MTNTGLPNKNGERDFTSFFALNSPDIIKVSNFKAKISNGADGGPHSQVKVLAISGNSKHLKVVWNLTFVFYCIKVREDFLPIPTYAQN